MNPLPLAKRGRLIIAAAIFTALAVARAQDPIIKPPTSITTTTTTRLPAPNPVTAAQVTATQIEVRWPALEGAVKYQVTRSVPPSPAQVLADVTAPETRFVDNAVRPGSTYYYLVAAYNSSGLLGLKGAAPPVTVKSTPTAAFPIRSFSAEWAGPDRVQLRWAVADPAATGSVLLERLVTTDTGTVASQPWNAPLAALGYVDTVGVPGATRLLYRITMPGASTAITSNPLIPPTTTASAGATAMPAGGSTSFTVAPPLSLRVGSSGTALATGSGRWLSMNDAIATVDTAGAVRGVAAGQSHVVRLAPASDGSLAVTVVPVTVSP